MIKVAKEPLVHFLIIGAVLFGFFGLVGNKSAVRPDKIVVSTAKIGNLEQTFALTWQRPPDPDELKGLIEKYIQEEIYYRQATAMGLDRDDIVIRNRLKQKLEFFAEDVGAAEPTDAELAAYLAANSAEFRTADRVTFRQVFLSLARGPALEKDTAALATKLSGSTDGATLGDGFLLGDSFRGMSKSEAAQSFGNAFAEKLFVLPPGRWQGPIASSYGLHFVYVDALRPGTLPPLGDIRPLVEREWANARRVERLDAFYRVLRQGYDIVVEPPPAVEQSQTLVSGAAG
jgi:hypothetical protein